MSIMWPFNSDDSDDSTESEDTTETRTIENAKTVTRYFTEYRVSIEYSGERDDETEYVNEYTIKDSHVELQDVEPVLYEDLRVSRRSLGIPSRRVPSIRLNSERPKVVSLSNTDSIDIEEWEGLVAVVENVPVTVTQERDSPEDEWEDKYYELTDDFDPDDFDVTVWNRIEWAAKRDS